LGWEKIPKGLLLIRIIPIECSAPNEVRCVVHRAFQVVESFRLLLLVVFFERLKKTIHLPNISSEAKLAKEKIKQQGTLLAASLKE
jgi:hypothetical protein